MPVPSFIYLRLARCVLADCAPQAAACVFRKLSFSRLSIVLFPFSPQAKSGRLVAAPSCTDSQLQWQSCDPGSRQQLAMTQAAAQAAAAAAATVGEAPLVVQPVAEHSLYNIV